MSDDPNTDIERATWNVYEKSHPTWAVKLPVDVTIPTREGVVEGEGGDYLCIDSDGGLYPCDADTFEEMYEPADWGDDDVDEKVTLAVVDDGELTPVMDE